MHASSTGCVGGGAGQQAFCLAAKWMQTLAGTIQLRFSPVSLDYNTTRIRCRGTLTSGDITTSAEAMLLIQG